MNMSAGLCPIYIMLTKWFSMVLSRTWEARYMFIFELFELKAKRFNTAYRFVSRLCII